MEDQRVTKFGVLAAHILAVLLQCVYATTYPESHFTRCLLLYWLFLFGKGFLVLITPDGVWILMMVCVVGNPILSIPYSTIFPRHQIRHLSYNLVTPLDGHSSHPKDHIRKAKALSEWSCSKEHCDIKIFDTSHNTFLTYVGLKFNGRVTLLLV